MKKLETVTILLIFLISINGFRANAQQWQYVMDEGGNVYDLIVVNDTMFAGTQFGLYRSTDHGQTWTLQNEGLPKDTKINTVKEWNDHLVVGTGDGLYISADMGNSWSAFNNGFGGVNVTSLLVVDDGLFAATGGNGIFYIDDINGSWTVKNLGLGLYPVIYSLAVKGNLLFAGSWEEGVFVSDNNGDSWTASNNGLSTLSISMIFVRGSKVFVGTDAGIGEVSGFFVSTDNGDNWTLLNTPFESAVLCGLNYGETMLLGTFDDGAVYSNDEGETWSFWNEGIPKFTVYCLEVFDNYYWAGFCCGYGIYKRPTSLITGIENQKIDMANKITLFPNPANESITVDFNTKYRNTVLEIYDMKGNLLTKKTVNNYPLKIDIKNLPSATYIVEIKENGKHIASKSMIKK